MPHSLPQLQPFQKLRLLVAAVALLVIGWGIVLMSADVLGKIESQSSASTDNVQWALAQTEVELLNLLFAMDDVSHGGNLAEVRLRFDIFYNRIKTIGVGAAFSELHVSPQFIECFGEAEAFVDQTVALMDGPDATLLAALPDLQREGKARLEDARNIALTGLQAYAERADGERRGIVRTLILAGALTILLVGILVVILAMTLRLYRINRQRAAENLATLSRLDSIVSTAMDAVITVNAVGKIVDFNETAQQTFGLSKADVMGRQIESLFSLPPGPDDPLNPDAAALDRSKRVRILANHRDGHNFPAEISVSKAESGDGPLTVVFLRDLSAQLETEQALVAARDKALAGEKAKADLLVVMSHEIRTPLNGMIGTIELLDSTYLLPQQREYLRILAASGKLLMHHVNDVLDIARLDSGKVSETREPLDLDALIGEVLQNQEPASKLNGNELIKIGPRDGRTMVSADAAMLRQVLLNLVGNAVKFTKQGQIVVQFDHLSATGPTVITVQDTGAGIEKQDLGRIFDDFVTLDPSYARGASGTGLGLGIVRRTVEHLGGTIRVESQPQLGSSFRVELPLTILPVVNAPKTAAVAAGKRLEAGHPPLTLVIEDNTFNRVIVKEMLLKEGHNVVEAANGEEGIRLANSRGFDLILMDISMPKVDGVQAARAILAGNGPSNRTPIVAMTAHAMQSEAELFRNEGMADVLVKPITRETLRDLLRKVLNFGEPVLVSIETLQSLHSDLGEEKASKLIGKFLSETTRQLATLHKVSLTDEADERIMRDLHRLLGSAAMFGASALQAELTHIATHWKTGNRHQATRLIDGLEPLWQRTAARYHDLTDFPQLSSLR